MKHTLSAILLLLVSLSAAQSPERRNSATKSDHEPYSVCAVLKEGQKLDGTIVLVSGTVLADRHSVVLGGTNCGGMFLSHEWGQDGNLWKVFDDHIARKAGGNDKRTLHVTVRGIYHNALEHGGRRIRQMELTEVIEARFVENGVN